MEGITIRFKVTRKTRKGLWFFGLVVVVVVVVSVAAILGSGRRGGSSIYSRHA